MISEFEKTDAVINRKVVKIDGVVVLFNPAENVFDNIKTYSDELKILYVIDNSNKKNISFLERIKELKNCEYIDNCGNQGIANPLNIAAKKAIANGADWLLTMDQDSSFEKASLENMISWIEQNDTTNVGIVSPLHSLAEQNMLEDEIFNTITMTSGNLLNLRVFQNVGDFMEKFFIDLVDTEYCLRLKKNGYTIKRVPTALLKHSLGAMQEYEIFGKRYVATHHSAVRRYYMTRNRLFVWREYAQVSPAFVVQDKRAVFNEFKQIILFEKNKLKKLYFILKGAYDFWKSKYGKIDE